MDSPRLLAWAQRRQPKKGKSWIMDQYWRITKVKVGVFNLPAVITSYTGTPALRFAGM
jgi:hypothetical protein